jgi:hypothetical protein
MKMRNERLGRRASRVVGNKEIRKNQPRSIAINIGGLVKIANGDLTDRKGMGLRKKTANDAVRFSAESMIVIRAFLHERSLAARSIMRTMIRGIPTTIGRISRKMA